MDRRLFAPILLALAACSPNASDPNTLFGEWTPTADTGGDTDTDTGGDTDTEPTDAGWVEHCDAITADTTWTADNGPHLVTCELKVESGTLTIDAGTVVTVAEGASITVGAGTSFAGLIAQGTESAPVRFEPLGPVRAGFWRGLRLAANTTTAELHHTEVLGGGASGTDGAVDVRGASVTVDSLTISDSAGVGLWLHDDGRLADGASGLTIARSTRYPVRVTPRWAGSLPADFIQLDNGDPAIALAATNRKVTAAVELPSVSVPFVVEDLIELSGTVSTPASLTIPAGSTLLFSTGTSIQVGTVSGVAALYSDGTAAAPVLLASLDDSTAARWGGIIAYPSALDDGLVLHHTTLRSAGGAFSTAYTNLEAAITVEGTPLELVSVSIEDALGTGIVLEGTAAFTSASSDVSVTGCDLPLELTTPAMHTIPAGSDWTGNTLDAIQVRANLPIKTEVVWRDPGVAYEFIGNPQIDGRTTTAAVTVEAGVELRLRDRSSILVNGHTATFLTQGTAGAPVVITAAQAFVPGAWQRVVAAACDGTAETRSQIQLNNTELSWGGDDRSSGMVTSEKDCHAEVQGGAFRNSAGYGISGDATVDGSTVFENNALGPYPENN